MRRRRRDYGPMREYPEIEAAQAAMREVTIDVPEVARVMTESYARGIRFGLAWAAGARGRSPAEEIEHQCQVARAASRMVERP